MYSLGERIRGLRKQAGMTQEELGRMLSVGKSTISQYESNIRTPDLDSVRRLADVFQVPTDYLLGRTDDPGAAPPTSQAPSDLAPYLEKHAWLQRLSHDLQRKMVPVIDVGLINRVYGHHAPAGGFNGMTDRQLTEICEILVDHFAREEELRKKLGLPVDIYKQQQD